MGNVKQEVVYASGGREDIIILECGSSDNTYNICSLHSHVAYPSNRRGPRFGQRIIENVEKQFNLNEAQS
jgi:hypothetical protein